MTRPESELIDRLVADAEPVRPLHPVRARLAAWLALEAVLVAVLLLVLPDDAIGLAAPPLRTLETVYLVGASAVLAAIAFAAAVPGGAEGRGLPLLVGALALAAAVPTVGEPAHAGFSLGEFLATGIPCTLKTFAVSLLPALALLLAVRRGAPLHPRLAGATAAGAALLLAHAALRLACPAHDLVHVLSWHVGAIWMGLLAGAGLGGRWVGRWRT
jgi:hypothetical protein